MTTKTSMKARSITKADYETIKKWHQLHQEGEYNTDVFPTTGLIVDNVAAGFIYFTNSPIAWIENFVTNPEVSPFKRSKAISLIAEGLIQLAVDGGFKYCQATTSLHSVGRRAEQFGFKPADMVQRFILALPTKKDI